MSKLEVDRAVFALKRGVKQEDPLSSLLFIAVMQACFHELHEKWAAANCKRRGIKFGLDLGIAGRN